jgi:hypothetical protein
MNVVVHVQAFKSGLVSRVTWHLSTAAITANTTMADTTLTITGPPSITTNPPKPVDDRSGTTTTIVANISVPMAAVEMCDGAAGDTHPVSPNTAGPRAGILLFLYIVLYSSNFKHVDSHAYSTTQSS